MNYVPQKDRSGCGIACVAMVTGNTYDEIRESFLTMPYAKANTPHGFPPDFLLTAVGGGCSHVILERLISMHTKKWVPVIPFHGPLIRSVRSPVGSHFVVVDGDGKVWDPAKEAGEKGQS